MNAKWLEQSVWAATTLLVIAGSLVMRYQHIVLEVPTVPHLTPHSSHSTRAGPQRANAMDDVRTIVGGDLFRRERQAPDSAPTTQSAQPVDRPPAPPKPRLVLQGLVGGPPWDAIVQGLPGHEGSYVVRAGDSVGGLRVKSVRRDGATIRGMDTTWTLKLGRAP